MLWDLLRLLFTPYLDPTTLLLSWLPDGSKALAIQTLPGLSCLPSTAPTAQFGGQGCAGGVYSQPGGDPWSCPCWGIPLEGDTGEHSSSCATRAGQCGPRVTGGGSRACKCFREWGHEGRGEGDLLEGHPPHGS